MDINEIENEIDDMSVKHKALLIFALVLIDLLVFWLDSTTGAALSLQPLYVIPVVVSGLLLGKISMALFAILSTVLRVEGYRRSVYTGTDFPYLPNHLTTFIAMLVIGGVVVLAGHYRKRSRAHQEGSVARRLGDLPPLQRKRRPRF